MPDDSRWSSRGGGPTDEPLRGPRLRRGGEHSAPARRPPVPARAVVRRPGDRGGRRLQRRHRRRGRGAPGIAAGGGPSSGQQPGPGTRVRPRLPAGARGGRRRRLADHHAGGRHDQRPRRASGRMLVAARCGADVVLASHHAGGALVERQRARRVLSAPAAHAIRRTSASTPRRCRPSSASTAPERAATPATRATATPFIREGGFACKAEILIKLARIAPRCRRCPWCWTGRGARARARCACSPR